MQFVVCEQARLSEATVHRCDCRKAQVQERQSLDFRVHGPFGTGQQAMSAAARTGMRRVSNCGSCRP